jgi:hypothetical protein
MILETVAWIIRPWIFILFAFDGRPFSPSGPFSDQIPRQGLQQEVP